MLNSFIHEANIVIVNNNDDHVFVVMILKMTDTKPYLFYLRLISSSTHILNMVLKPVPAHFNKHKAHSNILDG